MKLQCSRIMMLVLIAVLFLTFSSVYAKTAEEYFKLGVVAYDQRNFIQAIADYTKAIEINPNYTAAYHNRGLVYSAQRNFIQAIADYTKAIEINPSLGAAYNNRGLAHHNRGTVYGNQDNFIQAIADYTKAIEINPNYAQAYYNRGFAYFMTKEYSLAWFDVYAAEGLGLVINSEFLNELREASGRDK